MTKIRNEITELIIQEAPPEEFIKLFRSWALQMVDEDWVITHAMIGDPMLWRGRNEEKERMRKRIEEELEE